MAEGSKNFPDFPAFIREAPHTLSDSLSRISKIIERTEETSFSFVCRIEFGPTLEFEDWDRQNRRELDQLIPQAEVAQKVLERYLERHQSSLHDSKHSAPKPTITRTDVLDELRKNGLTPAPKRSEEEILGAFKSASSIGRNWLRTIAGKSIPRVELSELITNIKSESNSLLLTDRAGSGKTCLLLDLADYIEQSTSWGLLFIKGEQFADVKSELELSARGLPEDIVGQCARLAEVRQVVVIIDSLDVLSLSRNHEALGIFLGLIDRLERVSGVAVIAACRDFDLQYDTLLRGRKWQQKISLGLLDFESEVAPFLLNWGTDPYSLDPKLQELLQLPQNLRLFEKLARAPDSLQILSAYDLYECFLAEIVMPDPQLGEGALIALQDAAELSIRQRSQNFPRASFAAKEATIQRLISQEVLIEPSLSSLAFSHPTWADFFAVRSAFARNMTFAQFILTHPPLPFIRPAVRAFFFFLRAHNSGIFRRQLWEVLSRESIAYHLKRLVCESLAEITPTEEDWPLCRRIFQQHPDLFRRLFLRMKGDAWFEILTQHWLPDAKVAPDRENWLQLFTARLTVYGNQHATQIIALWQESLASNWTDQQQLTWAIVHGLGELEAWDTPGIRELFDTLLDEAKGKRDFRGKSLSKWVEASDSGDELLWRYIVRHVVPEDFPYGVKDKLGCKPHEFHDENFLTQRLCQSDKLLTLALEDLELWSTTRQEDRLQNAFLSHTSWERRHSRHDMYHVASLNVLLDSLEEALKYRSRKYDVWWQSNEPLWRFSYEESIRYLIIEAYKENIEANIQGIEAQITDRHLLRYSSLHYEIGELLRAAYPCISPSVQLANQAIILSLYADKGREKDREAEWDAHEIYNLLIWIPAIFRTVETQNFIETWQGYFGGALPQPDIRSWGGSVVSPVPLQQLLQLSDESLLRLLHHYDKRSTRSERSDDGLIGGPHQIESVLSEASSRDPKRFLTLFIRLEKEDVALGYGCAIVEGVSSHLRYRFGNLQPQNGWEPHEPLLEGHPLAKSLLDLLERHPFLWQKGYTMSHALKTCCEVLVDYESVERLIFLLFILSYAEDPSNEPGEEDEEKLVQTSLSSPRGVASGSAMILCNHFLENEIQLPELLSSLLHRFARDSAIGVRVSILRRLPYLMHKQPGLGWSLFSNIFREPQTHLWSQAEKCFYHQYQDSFQMVKPYLDRILREAQEEAGSTWGRIAALACLSGHIGQGQLFENLRTGSSGMRDGAAQVFSATIGLAEHSELCTSGLLFILSHGEATDDTLHSIERSFGKESNHAFIKCELALMLLQSLPKGENQHSMSGLFEWLAYKSRHSPWSALPLMETLADKLEQQEDPQQLWQTEALASALIEILREADETDDKEMIQRVIKLQDRFLKIDLYGMENLLDQATRS